MGISTLVPINVDEMECGGPLLQTRVWARFKQRFGWQPLAFQLGSPRDSGAASQTRGQILFLMRRLAPGIRLAYCPHGPAVNVRGSARTAFLGELSEAVRSHLPNECVLIRYDPLWETTGPEGHPPPDSSAGTAAGLEPPLRPAAVDIQPPDTVIVSLEGSEQDILAGMRSKTRYNVRLSGRKGVRVRESDVKEIDLWYSMYLETADRDRIAIHSKTYYQALFEEAGVDPDAGVRVRLLFAEVESEPVAGIIVTTHGAGGLYHFGASTGKHRNLMPTYALQWEAMKRCKDDGCCAYDLGGIPPNDDPAHPMHGLYRMKTGFGGRIVHRVGSWDYPLRRPAYAAYRVAERVRSYYFKTIKKKGR